MSDAAERRRQILAVAEREFGTDWLLWKSGKQGGQRSQQAHPVAVQWAEARELLDQLKAGAPVSLENRPNLALLEEVAADLQVAQNIPNFAKAIRSRLKTSEFEKAQFEMHVGSLYQRSGQRVEFVPATGKRRLADLKVILGERDVYIECTRKDSYTPDCYDDSGARKSLAEDILSLQTELSAALEVVAVVPGALDPRLSADVLNAIRKRIENGERGYWTRATDGLGFVPREPEGTTQFPHQARHYRASWRPPAGYASRSRVRRTHF